MSLNNEYIVEKSNVLNEIRSNRMTLQELRFFSIYLAKINARDVSTRRVCFPLSDFQKIMEFGRLNIKQLQTSTNKLLCKVVNVPNADGGYTGFTIFKRVRVFKDDSEKWCIEIDASDDALPLLFDLKKNYFTYELWNVLRLKSVNQLRMYELLKQYEYAGTLEIKTLELREYLFLTPSQYPSLKDFKLYILNSCQKALAEKTDICYTYECGKRGMHGKWLTIVFHISKNQDYKDPIKLEEFIGEKQLPELPQSQQSEHLSGDFERDLSQHEIELLCDILKDKVPTASERTPERLRTLLKALYSEMILKSKEPVRKPVSYLLRMIDNIDPEKLSSVSEEPTKKKQSNRRKIHQDDDFDVEKYKIFINDFTVI